MQLESKFPNNGLQMTIHRWVQSGHGTVRNRTWKLWRSSAELWLAAEA